MKFTESTVEEAALECLQSLGYEYRPGPDIAHDGLFPERLGYEDVTFARGRALLRQNPVQAESRSQLRDLLRVAGGGVVFTTIQKFMPEDGHDYPLLSDRRNIIVIADEAHRSQYAFIDGFARHMRDALPKASFVGFTGTPIEKGDKSTTAVFGDHISVYDVEQAIEDGVTVRIYYESRLAKIDLDAAERPKIDPKFEEITETEEAPAKTRLARKWSRLEAMVGADRRLNLIAKDIVQHFEQRLEVMDGKAMIVCMSRRICVDLFERLIKLRPGWDSPDFAKGAIKVVMTGAADDPSRYHRHLMTGQVRKLVENRFKDPADPLRLVIVRDMWLTGFAEVLFGLAGVNPRTFLAQPLDTNVILPQERDLSGQQEWEDIEQHRVETSDVPETTRQALIQARVGQGLFKRNVSQLEHTCRLTFVDNPAHLIGSHIKPWRECSNEERLAGSNGLLLTPTSSSASTSVSRRKLANQPPSAEMTYE